MKPVEGDGEKLEDLTIVGDIDENKDVTATTKEAQLESKIYNVTAREDCVTWGKQINRITHVFAPKRDEKEFISLPFKSIDFQLKDISVIPCETR